MVEVLRGIEEMHAQGWMHLGENEQRYCIQLAQEL